MQETGPIGGTVLFGNRLSLFNINKKRSTFSDTEQATIPRPLLNESDSEETHITSVQSLQSVKE